jgi:hypothetical protein
MPPKPLQLADEQMGDAYRPANRKAGREQSAPNRNRADRVCDFGSFRH